MIGVILIFYTFFVLLIFFSSTLSTIISTGVLIVINLILKNKRILIESILYVLSDILLFITFINTPINNNNVIPQFESDGFLVVAFISVVLLIVLIVDVIKIIINKNKKEKKKKIKKVR